MGRSVGASPSALVRGSTPTDSTSAASVPGSRVLPNIRPQSCRSGKRKKDRRRNVPRVLNGPSTVSRPHKLAAWDRWRQTKRAIWQGPMLPRGCPLSRVGAAACHDRVRDGNGWVHRAVPPDRCALVAYLAAAIRRSCRYPSQALPRGRPGREEEMQTHGRALQPHLGQDEQTLKTVCHQIKPAPSAPEPLPQGEEHPDATLGFAEEEALSPSNGVITSHLAHIQHA